MCGILTYTPTKTKVTLDGNSISNVLNHKPIYIVKDNKKYVVECCVEYKDATYLFAGECLGELNCLEN